MRKRILYLVCIFLFITVVFIIAKPLFMLYNIGNHDFSMGDVCCVIGHGLTLDLSTAIYFFLLPYLLTIISLWWDGWRYLRTILKYYYGIVAACFALIFTADASLYQFWDFKLDSSVFQYIDTTGDAFVSVSAGYLIIRVIAIACIGFLIYKGFSKITPKNSNLCQLSTNIYSTIAAIILVGPLIIGIRGGMSESTTNIGQVYYSSNQFLNHSAVNPVFSFMASFEKTADDDIEYHYFDDQKCAALLKDAFTTESIDCDSLLNTSRPNIVIIEMEGCGGAYTELGGHPEIMPNLNSLAHEGIYFTNCYGNSYRTDRGTVCNFSGYPSFPMTSVMKIPAKSRTLPSIAHSKENDNSQEQNSSKWGVSDDITFETLYQQIINNRAKHWHTGFLTLSSHEPWTVPIHRFSYEVYNAFAFLDDCIGNFINKVRKTPQWKNMLIIFVPDHAIRYPNYLES